MSEEGIEAGGEDRALEGGGSYFIWGVVLLVLYPISVFPCSAILDVKCGIVRTGLCGYAQEFLEFFYYPVIVVLIYAHLNIPGAEHVTKALFDFFKALVP